MTAVIIDANVLLDVMTEDPVWLDWSAAAIAHAANHHFPIFSLVLTRPLLDIH